MKNKILSGIALLLALLICMSCAGPSGDKPLDPPTAPILNGVDISEYVIVFSAKEHDYNQRAATYIQEKIKERTSVELEVVTENAEKRSDYEIIVGETSRDISKHLNADTSGMQFATLAEENKIALEGDYFVIAAAAYFFVETYITGDKFYSDVPTTVSIHEPIVKEAKNYIFLIGDGMGVYQTKLFDAMEIPKSNDYSDKEDFFYGYMFPAQGFSMTYSLSGVTDSAAGGTALSCGYKVDNEYIGMIKRRELKSLTELAASLGMSTAVMSTDVQTGATPASFSAHAKNRELATVIKQSQDELVKNCGTIISCGFNDYIPVKITELENKITSTLDELDNNEKGFFIMYEEAHIDKHCHSNDMEKAFLALLRFNQAIARFMEYSFYNPETFVIMTADHETGGLAPDENGKFAYSTTNHSGADVPVFAYGHNSELFDGKTVNNVQIPKTIASFWGVKDFGNPELEGSLVN